MSSQFTPPIGGMHKAPGAGAIAMGRAPSDGPQYQMPWQAAPNPYVVAHGWNNATGGMTTRQALSTIQSGGSPWATTAQPLAPESAPSAPAAPPGPPPEQAGAINAAAPGALNGNTENGVPKEESGFNPLAPMQRRAAQSGDKGMEKMPTIGAPPQAKADVMPISPPPAEAPPPAVPAAPVAPPAAAPPVATPERPIETPSMPGGAAAGDVSAVAREAAAAPGAASPAAALPTVPTKSAVAGAGTTPGSSNEPAPAPTSSTSIKYGGVDVPTSRAGSQKSFNAMTPQQQADWIRKYYKAPAGTTVTGSDTTTLSQFPLPIKNDIVKLMQEQALLNNFSDTNTGSAANPTAIRQRAAHQAKVDKMVAALAAKGITYQAKAPEPTPTPDAGGGSGIPPTGGVGDESTGDKQVIGSPDDPNTNLDLSDLDPATQTGDLNLINHLPGKSYEEKLAYFEALQSAALNQNKRNDTQSAVDVLHGGQTALENDPLYKGSRGIAEDIMAHPLTVDEQALENKTVADSHAALRNNLDAASQSFNRRGIGAAGAAGLTGELYREQANDLSSRLGDLKIAQGERERADRNSAIQTGLTTMAGTTGASLGINTNIANTLTGNSANDTNPFSGIASAISNINAQQAAADAAKKAGGFTAADAVGLLGIVAAPFTSGASLALTGAALKGGAGKETL